MSEAAKNGCLHPLKYQPKQVAADAAQKYFADGK
jgi:hypothetical protein